MDVDKALATQLANIEKRSGKSLAELAAIIARSGLTRHTEVVAMLKADLGLGHGDANTVVHLAKQAAAPEPAANAEPLDAIYGGGYAALRAIHEHLMADIRTFGPFEIAPKKAYVSLRRKATPGGMCQFKRRIAGVAEIDSALMAAIRVAYDEAG